LLILDGYSSYYSYKFEYYYKENNIVILYIFFHSFYLFQPFDIGCFSVLKRSYSKEIKNFIRSYINYITKPDFFACFYIVFFVTFGEENVRVGFRDIGLVSFNPETVISKFDIKLYISTSIGPPLAEVDL
jgi:hypothetical protein